MSEIITLDAGVNKYIQKKFENNDDIANETIRKAISTQTLDLLTNHIPDVSGGYIILVDLGDWVNYLDKSTLLMLKYKPQNLNKFKTLIDEFNKKCVNIAYQIDVGNKSVSSDNYNLRHMQSQVFGYLTQINSITITYLSDHLSMVNTIHNLWLEFMEDTIKGGVRLGPEYLAKDTDIFYPVPYYGRVYCYVFNPLTLYPKEIIKFMGIYPDANSLQGMIGTRGQNEHYMKAISYKVMNYEFASYIGTEGESTSEALINFAQIDLFSEFMDLLNNRIQ